MVNLELLYDPTFLFLRYPLKRSQKDLYINVYSNIIHHNQKAETTLMPMKWVEQKPWYIHIMNTI